MSLGNFETKDYSNEEQEKNEVINATKADLSDLMKTIQMKNFLNNDEKQEEADSVRYENEKENIAKNINANESMLATGNAMAWLLSNIQQSVWSKLFREKWQQGSPEEYQQQKQRQHDKQSDNLTLATINNFYENKGMFHVPWGSALEETIQTHNENMVNGQNAVNDYIASNIGVFDRPVIENAYTKKATQSDTNQDHYFHQYERPQDIS